MTGRWWIQTRAAIEGSRQMVHLRRQESNQEQGESMVCAFSTRDQSIHHDLAADCSHLVGHNPVVVHNLAAGSHLARHGDSLGASVDQGRMRRLWEKSVSNSPDSMDHDRRMIKVREQRTRET